jgi:DNA-binding transcriptional LysR family regulator
VLALAEARNYLRAAEALHISQSALSCSIQSLETTLGVAWLRGRTLSLPGRAFVDLVLEHDAELLELEQSLFR